MFSIGFSYSDGYVTQVKDSGLRWIFKGYWGGKFFDHYAEYSSLKFTRDHRLSAIITCFTDLSLPHSLPNVHCSHSQHILYGAFWQCDV